jgi:hypothetical protein
MKIKIEAQPPIHQRAARMDFDSANATKIRVDYQHQTFCALQIVQRHLRSVSAATFQALHVLDDVPAGTDGSNELDSDSLGS